MPRMLATHNSACNDIFLKLQECEAEYPFRRFLGYCSDAQKKVDKCVADLRIEKRRINSEKAKQNQERLKAALNDSKID